MMLGHSLVSVVDDDVSVRESLPDLLRELGYAAAAFSSAEEVLASDCIGQTECLLLDIAMPGISGPDLHSELTLQGRNIPVIYITGGGDQTTRACMLKRGAVECLRKLVWPATRLPPFFAGADVFSHVRCCCVRRP